MRSFLILSAAVSADAVLLKKSSNSPDYGFLDGGAPPKFCMGKLSTPEKEYLKGFFTSNLEGGNSSQGVTKQAYTVFTAAHECWATIVKETACKALPDAGRVEKAKAEVKAKCQDESYTAQEFWNEHKLVKNEEIKYYGKTYPNQLDNNGDPVPENYSEVMNVVSKLAPKNVLCYMFDAIDSKCQYTGPYAP
jgi:hypothetical protein